MTQPNKNGIVHYGGLALQALSIALVSWLFTTVESVKVDVAIIKERVSNLKEKVDGNAMPVIQKAPASTTYVHKYHEKNTD